MKRREFLVTSVGLTGTLLPSFASAQVKPCPPPLLGLGDRNTVATSCQAPTWFSELPEKTWVQIAAGSSFAGSAWQRGTAFRDVIPGHPGDHIPALPMVNMFSQEGPTAVFDVWTGACVDQDRKQLLLVANGGHFGYAGNEVYALDLDGAAPAYVRLTDPTPPGLDSAGNPTYVWNNVVTPYWRNDRSERAPASFNDGIGQGSPGRMRPVHNYHRVNYANGRAWHCSQDGFTTSGGQTPAVWSFNRDWVESQSEKPLRHRVSQSANVWTSHGMPELTGDYQYNTHRFNGYPSAYDPLSHKIYQFTSLQNAAGSAYQAYSVDTRTGQISTFAIPLPALAAGGSWAVCVHDVIPGQTLMYYSLLQSPPNDIGIWNLTTNQIYHRTPSNSPLWPDPHGQLATSTANKMGYGAVYHPKSRAILVFAGNHPTTGGLGTTIRKLPIPADPIGGDYTWQEVVGNGVAPAVTANTQGTYSRFNIVQDMGTGESCLVLAGSSAATYVYKVPRAGV